VGKLGNRGPEIGNHFLGFGLDQSAFAPPLAPLLCKDLTECIPQRLGQRRIVPWTMRGEVKLDAAVYIAVPIRLVVRALLLLDLALPLRLAIAVGLGDDLLTLFKCEDHGLLLHQKANYSIYWRDRGYQTTSERGSRGSRSCRGCARPAS